MREKTSNKHFKNQGKKSELDLKTLIEYAVNIDQAQTFSAASSMFYNTSSDSEPKWRSQPQVSQRPRYPQNNQTNYRNQSQGGGNNNSNANTTNTGSIPQNQPTNLLNAVLNGMPRPQDSIMGKIGLEDVLTDYLYDTGAAVTVISEALYYRLNLTSNLELEPITTGEKLSSCNGKIIALGSLTIPNCRISENITIKDLKVHVIKDLVHHDFLMGRDLIDKVHVIKDLVHHDCLMGRDLIDKVPVLKQDTERTRENVDKLTSSLTC